MSGGSLDYFFGTLEDHIGDFDDYELDGLVKDLAKLFRDREWFLSGDTGEGDWVESMNAFKQKWFTEYGRIERVEEYLKDIRQNIMKSLGLFDDYCKNCVHWTPSHVSDGKDFPYGNCECCKTCLKHRSESCDQFAPKQAG